MAKLTRNCPTCGTECTIESDAFGDGYTPKFHKWVEAATNTLLDVRKMLKGQSASLTQKQLHYIVARLLREKPR